MSDQSSYAFDAAGVARFDQAQAVALDRIRACDSFVVVTATTDDEARYGTSLRQVAAVRTPFAPHFLAQAVSIVAALPLDAFDDLIRDNGLDHEQQR